MTDNVTSCPKHVATNSQDLCSRHMQTVNVVKHKGTQYKEPRQTQPVETSTEIKPTAERISSDYNPGQNTNTLTQKEITEVCAKLDKIIELNKEFELLMNNNT